MKRFPTAGAWLLALVATLSLSAMANAGDANAFPSPSAVQLAAPGPPGTARQRPDVPAIRLGKDGQPDQGFLQRHQMYLERGKGGPIGVLFIGDSITAGWLASGKDIWQKYYGGYHAANFGIGGDRTQGVLWRIEHGELDGISPSVVVLMIGTNNGTDPAVADGVKKVVEVIRAKLPKAKILLMGILPRGNDIRVSWVARGRDWIAGINNQLATLDDGKDVRFLDIGAKYVDAQGNIGKEILTDGVHPGAAGYQIWADAMQPLLDEMLKK